MARGLAMCAPTRARALVQPLLGDEPRIRDKTVGELIEPEIDHRARLRAYEARHGQCWARSLLKLKWM